MTFRQHLARQSILVKSVIALTLTLICAISPGPAAAATVVAEWLVPDHSSGLAWDGSRLWVGGIDEKGGYLQALDPARGEVLNTITAPVADCFGLEWFDDALAYLSPNCDSTVLIHNDGTLIYIPNPYAYMAGLAVKEGSLWSSSYFNPTRTLIQMDTEGRVLNSTPFLGRYCRDMTFHNEMLYVADRTTREIRVINPATGRMVDAFPTPGLNPSGLASDGEYLWLLDDGDKPGYDQLYKLLMRDNAGGIRFSELHHNYRSVVINEVSTWSVWIYNDGLQTAQRLSFEAEGGNDDIFVPHIWQFPLEIAAGDSVQLEISFQPAYPDSEHIQFAIMYNVDRVTNYLSLSGKGVRNNRQITVSNRNLDFGTTRAGRYVRSSNLRYLQIENSGGEPLTIERLEFGDDHFSAGIYNFPCILNEPGLIQVPIYFRPTGDNRYDSEVVIVSDDPNAPEIGVSLSGRGWLRDYSGGEKLWSMQLGDLNGVQPRVRAVIGMNDITGDGLSDVVIATNDNQIRAYHAASTNTTLPIWSYDAGLNPWRSGSVWGQSGLSWSDDWNYDGIREIVAGLEGDAMSVVSLSGLDGEKLWQFDTHGHRDRGGHIRAVEANWDLDGDGAADICAAAAAADDIHQTNAIFMLNGTSGEPQWEHELDGAPHWLKILRDVTGDALPDVITVCDDGKMVGMDGRRGRLIWEVTIEGDIRGVAIIDDVDGDGSQDVAVITYMHGIFMFSGANGDLIWHLPAGQPDFNVRYLTKVIALNDVNGNGSPDLVVGTAERFTWCIDGATMEFAWYEPVISATEVLSLARLSDLDHDGVDDFMVGTIEGRFFCVSGTGYPGLWSYINMGEGLGFINAVGIPDVDGNGYMDAIGVLGNGTVYCFAGSYIGDVDTTEMVGEEKLLPSGLTLSPAYPNPFNSVVVLPVSLAAPADVSFTITDLLGRRVLPPTKLTLPAGEHRLIWDAGLGAVQPPSGTYIVRMTGAGITQHRLITLVR